VSEIAEPKEPPPYPRRKAGGRDPHGIPRGHDGHDGSHAHDGQGSGGDPEGNQVEIRRGGGWRLGLVVAGVLALGLLTRPSLLVVILALVVIIFFHELGHYLTAKWSGMKVTEFFIGFGPRIWSFHRGETEYGLKAIPAGAYVRIIGMNNLDPVPPEEEARTYRQQSYPKRMLVVLAGSGMHFVMAAACIFALLVSGVPGGTIFDQQRLGEALDARDAGPWAVADVSEGSAADAAGIRPGDRILRIDGEAVPTWADVFEVVHPRAGEAVTIEVERDGSVLTLDAVIGDRDGRGFLGVGREFLTDITEPVPVHVAAARSVVEVGQGMWLSTRLLAQFFTGGLGDFAAQVVAGGRVEDTPAVGEPGAAAPPGEEVQEGENRLLSIIGAARLGADLTEGGWQGLAFFLVQINIFIGLFNLIPLLPLDGGHAAIATYERIRSRRGKRYMADISRLVPLTYAVVVFLIVLGVSAMYLDIVAPIRLG
jgi:membrane-associated protease RseP (regulator of RpoE activity)